jgi:anthranilate phosphoribosyltransferase
MKGQCTEAQIGAFLLGLRMKGETVEEITAFAEKMRSLCVRISPRVNGLLTDIVGTGGAPLKTFNVSTVSAFVVAGAGVPVAKHGNRGVSSGCGSADVLEALGVNLLLEPARVQEAIEHIGMGFMFAPHFHPAMKHVAKARKELGLRTVFNLLGPLTNPAGAPAQLLGVFCLELVDIYPEVLRKLGVRRALVVYGVDGVDEISITDETRASLLNAGEISSLRLHPRAYGLRAAQPDEIANLSPAESARLTIELLSSRVKDARYEMVLLNAGAAIFVSQRANSIEAGLARAEESIRSGGALEKLLDYVAFSQGRLNRVDLWTT